MGRQGLFDRIVEKLTTFDGCIVGPADPTDPSAAAADDDGCSARRQSSTQPTTSPKSPAQLFFQPSATIGSSSGVPSISLDPFATPPATSFASPRAARRTTAAAPQTQATSGTGALRSRALGSLVPTRQSVLQTLDSGGGGGAKDDGGGAPGAGEASPALLLLARGLSPTTSLASSLQPQPQPPAPPPPPPRRRPSVAYASVMEGEIAREREAEERRRPVRPPPRLQPPAAAVDAACDASAADGGSDSGEGGGTVAAARPALATMLRPGVSARGMPCSAWQPGDRAAAEAEAAAAACSEAASRSASAALRASLADVVREFASLQARRRRWQRGAGSAAAVTAAPTPPSTSPSLSLSLSLSSTPGGQHQQQQQRRDFRLENRRHLAVVLEAKRSTRISCLERLARRERHRREVEGRREERLVQEERANRLTLQQKVRAALFVRDEQARRARRAEAAQLWFTAVVALRFPRRLSRLYAVEVRALQSTALARSRLVLRTRLLPLWRERRRLRLRRRLVACFLAAYWSVRCRSNLLRSAADRITSFLRSYARDTTLALQQYLRVTRRTHAVLTRMLRRRAAEFAFVAQWVRLVEVWLILRETELYVPTNDPDRAATLAAAASFTSFVTARPDRVPLHHRLVCGDDPPLLALRAILAEPAAGSGGSERRAAAAAAAALSVSTSLPAAAASTTSVPAPSVLHTGCPFQELCRQSRAQRNRVRLRTAFYKEFVRPVRKVRAAMAAAAAAAAVPPAEADEAPPKKVLKRRSRFSGVGSGGGDELLPPPLCALRLPDAARHAVVLALRRSFRVAVSETINRNRVRATFDTHLKHVLRALPGRYVTPAEGGGGGDGAKGLTPAQQPSGATRMVTEHNEAEIVRRVREALDGWLLERTISVSAAVSAAAASEGRGRAGGGGGGVVSLPPISSHDLPSPSSARFR